MVKRDRRPHTFTSQWPLGCCEMVDSGELPRSKEEKGRGASLSLCPLLSAVTSPLLVTREPFSADTGK